MQIPQDLLHALTRARKLVVLDGAGLSAASGIPTFREAQTGLWARYEPTELATPQAFSKDPKTVWEWYAWRRRLIAGSQPNAGHRALAELARRLPGLQVITQNVDGLHRLAGLEAVLELHGNIRRSICSVTRREIDSQWLERHADVSPPPSPHHPDGLARPDVVWFGESLDEAVLTTALNAAEQCDFMLVAGTSGAVQPAASLPAIARQAGAQIADINLQPGEIARLAHWHLSGPAEHWLPRLVEALETGA